MAKQARKDPLVWGVILIVLGLMFLLKFDIWYALAHFWPVILIIWGAFKLYYGLKERKEEPKTGITQD
ncbi:MAG: hypothetical protein JXB23_04805 [Candidatus Aminicenantes bacterium]|nr:hypothetical protein [Candidatus Aminicenantes bacterium]